MIKLHPFASSDFTDLISWIDSEELLITIAGRVFAYPLTREQLQHYLRQKSSYSFTIVDSDLNKKIGHAEIVLSGNSTYKIDKLIIGETANRGKGIGQQVINELLEYSFERLRADVVELNVFDWNTAGIRCYRKCGFTFNEMKSEKFLAGDKIWTALNMVITRAAHTKLRPTTSKHNLLKNAKGRLY